jgi:hypothetical protein
VYAASSCCCSHDTTRAETHLKGKVADNIKAKAPSHVVIGQLST